MAVALNYFDRFMSTLPFVGDARVYKLVGATSLYLSMKVSRDAGKCADSKSFSALSHGDFSAAEIEETEQSMLRALEWRVVSDLQQLSRRPAALTSFEMSALLDRNASTHPPRCSIWS